jgi:hypothetical protein
VIGAEPGVHCEAGARSDNVYSNAPITRTHRCGRLSPKSINPEHILGKISLACNSLQLKPIDVGCGVVRGGDVACLGGDDERVRVAFLRVGSEVERGRHSRSPGRILDKVVVAEDQRTRAESSPHGGNGYRRGRPVGRDGGDCVVDAGRVEQYSDSADGPGGWND